MVSCNMSISEVLKCECIFRTMKCNTIYLMTFYIPKSLKNEAVDKYFSNCEFYFIVSFYKNSLIKEEKLSQVNFCGNIFVWILSKGKISLIFELCVIIFVYI